MQQAPHLQEQDGTCRDGDVELTPPREPPPQPRGPAAGERNRDGDGDAKKERRKKRQSVPPAAVAAGLGEHGLSSLPPGQLPSVLPSQFWSGLRGPTWLTYCQAPHPIPSPRQPRSPQQPCVHKAPSDHPIYPAVGKPSPILQHPKPNLMGKPLKSCPRLHVS